MTIVPAAGAAPSAAGGGRVVPGVGVTVGPLTGGGNVTSRNGVGSGMGAVAGPDGTIADVHAAARATNTQARNTFFTIRPYLCMLTRVQRASRTSR